MNPEWLLCQLTKESGDIQNSCFFLQEVNPDIEISGKVGFDLAPEVAEVTGK